MLGRHNNNRVIVLGTAETAVVAIRIIVDCPLGLVLVVVVR